MIRAYGLWLAVFLILWAVLVLFLARGFGGLREHDPVLRQQREAAFLFPALPSGSRPFVAWFGDSVCLATGGEGPPFGQLMGESLCGPRGALRGWDFVPICRSGIHGPHFLFVARWLLRRGAIPRAAVLPVNLRSLNALGSSNFLAEPPPEALAPTAPARATGLRAWSRDGISLWRGAAALGRGLLEGLFEPARLPRLPAPPPPKEAIYQSIYGQGYALDLRMLGTLSQAGQLLRSRGCRVFYYLTPVERVELAARLGPELVQALDRAAGQAAGILRRDGFEVLDLHAEAVPFIDLPSEHLAVAGRRRVADRLEHWLGQVKAGGRR